jgi:hypothetical protein
MADQKEHIFPELAESDDGKIRKWLINLVKSHIRWLEDRVKEQLSNGQIYGGELSKAQVSLAWLEKQSEQKSVDAPQDLSAFKAQLKEYLLEEGWSKADPIYLDGAVAYKTESLLALIPGTAGWSEEDEKDLQHIMQILKEQAYTDYDVDEDGELCGVYKHLSNWLQSLRSQRLKEK